MSNELKRCPLCGQCVSNIMHERLVGLTTVAPELLEVANELSAEMHRWPDLRGPLLTKLDTVIAKAEGRT